MTIGINKIWIIPKLPMSKLKELFVGPDHHLHHIETIKLIFRGLIPIVLVVGGIVLMTLRLSVWGLVLGIPMIIIGVVFLIYTYDAVVSERILPFSDKFVNCSVCGKLTPLSPATDPQDAICATCKADIENGLRSPK